MVSLRELGKENKGITEPEIIMSNTAHAAFNKACHYFKVKPVEVDGTKKNGYVLVAADVRRKITKNTVAIICSLGNYPHGLLDDIEGISKVAEEFNIPIHVDCCLGGYSMIFGRDVGAPIPIFDFRQKMVYSISIDPHKYGLAPKGASLVLFKNQEIKHAGIYVYETWPGGLYGTVSISGSRPCASMVGAWIATMVTGKEGMRKNVRDIYGCLTSMKKQISKIDGLSLIGDPILNVIAITSSIKGCTDFMLSDSLTKKGWKLQVCQKPICLHLAITLANIDKCRDQFVSDLKECIIDVKKNPEDYSKSTSGQIYGSTAKAPDGIIIEQVMKACISEFSFI